MFKVLTLPESFDSRPLREALWAEKIGHQITLSQARPTEAASGDDAESHEGGQELWLADPDQLPRVIAMLERQSRGEPLRDASAGAATRGGGSSQSLIALVRQTPLTWLVGLACCVTVLFQYALGQAAVFEWLAIVPFELVGSQHIAPEPLSVTLAGEWWRLWSPSLMHFGVLHLVFNLLWLWVFGRQIEAIDGGWRFALVVVLSGVAANLAQYATGSVLFGGLSGIDFAVIGYVFIAARRRPALGYQMQRSLMIFMLIYLVLCMTPLSSAIGLGAIANEAHLGGLLTGLLLGWLLPRRSAA
ncbi:rhomboid family intramembrane serine protease [Cobetia amphilecti]|jgi:GlpG protein|uniref:Rhomboid family intramembrane serine protease n=1 Tax=Cobetia amphilecti TaxID=1055104 RepID=A0ABT6UPF2_9GAMM|nr:rhomboid family intramembrane serine protease [Cobetia amphilecti]MBR9798426.1 rhomboid family intramembrane serine protease [Gammaproteobacteria bacterium]MDI5884566.1 rhomboid family intramembrane serine protease [Cobetia amphilecti]